jgi:acetyl esterase/lipase
MKIGPFYTDRNFVIIILTAVFFFPFTAFSQLSTDQQKAIPPDTISLWNGHSPIGDGKFSAEKASITVHLPANPNGAAVIICPGGGYGGLVTGPEGHGIAEWLNQRGIAGIVLEYRLPKGNSNLPLLDAQQAIRMVKLRAGDWNIDPQKIGIIGFSAGGHLASTAATHFDSGDQQAADPVARMSSRPDFAILIYPVISMGPLTHSGSKRNLLGPDPSPELVNRFSNEKQVTSHTPPTFMAHAQDDGTVSPENSQLLYDALMAHGVPARYLKLPYGGHGLNGYKGPMWDEWQAKSLLWLVENKIIPPIPILLRVSTAGELISPLLFGHNLEVTRKGIWSGLSAEMVANRKFAAVTGDLPKRWVIVGDSASVMIDTTVVYVGKRSTRVTVEQNNKPSGIFQQQEQLAFQKDKSFGIRVWVKTVTMRSLVIHLTGDSPKPFFETSLPCKPGDWQLVTVNFKSVSTQSNCSIEITSRDQGTFWIGAVSVLPADAFHGMRRDVIGLLKLIKPGILRFPGGCYAEFYNWQDGLLTADKRPPIGNTGLNFLFRDTDDTDNQEIGIDEFIALCREIGCQPAITTRLSDNTAADAAAWVEYCNGDASSPWGKARVDRGYKKPYQVEWWFVGNEIAYFGRGYVNNAAGCAARSRQFAEAMLKADSTINLVPSTWFVNGKPSSDWNFPLLESTGPFIKAVSTHQYILDQLPLKTAADYSSIISAPRLHTLPLLRQARNATNSQFPLSPKPGISYDEWNIIWGNQSSVPMALYTAGMLNMLCRESYPLGISLACFFMPVNEGAIKVNPLSATLDAAGLVFELFSAHQGNKLIKLPGEAGADLCASLSPNGKHLYITAVNDIINEQSLTFTIPADAKLKSSTATVKYLVPASLEIQETSFLVIEEKLSIPDGKSLVIKLPQGAIARVTIDLN